MKKLLILLLLIPMISFGEKKLSVKHKCPDWESLFACSDSCSLLDGWEWEFIINASNQTVLTKTFVNGKSTGVSDNGKCSVIDINNWVCEVVNETNNELKAHNKMIDGNFYNYITLRSEVVSLGTCAK